MTIIGTSFIIHVPSSGSSTLCRISLISISKSPCNSMSIPVDWEILCPSLEYIDTRSIPPSSNYKWVWSGIYYFLCKSLFLHILSFHNNIYVFWACMSPMLQNLIKNRQMCKKVLVFCCKLSIINAYLYIWKECPHIL